MSNEGTLPIVVLLGPRKCGTTTIHGLLAGMKGVAIPWPVKEAHIFDRGPLGGESIQLFAGKTLSEDSSIFVDVATHYFSDRKHWQAIKDTPSLRHVCVIVRDPVERTISHCLHQMRIGADWDKDFSTLIAEHPEIISDSLYSVTIPELRRFFGYQRVTLIPFTKIADAPEAVMQLLMPEKQVLQTDVGAQLPSEKMNITVQPVMPNLYRLARNCAGKIRLVLGETIVGVLKTKVIQFWPSHNLSATKSLIEKDMKNSDVYQSLLDERKYLASLMEQ